MMMKLPLLLFLFGRANAFIPRDVVLQRVPSTSALRARPDSSGAVAEALRVSREFGATSTEAKLAWETVEEMDGADMSPAISPATKSLSEHDVREMDYKVQLVSLNNLLSDTAEKLSQIKVLAANLKDLDIEDPTLSKLPETASGLKTVLQEAKSASEVFGPDSAESAAAWTEVDFCTEIMGGVECNVDTNYRYSAAALKAHHMYDAVVDAKFFEEAVDAIDMVQNLQKFVRIETSRLQSP